MFVYDCGEPFGHFVNRLPPGYLLKSVADLFERRGQTVGVVLIGLDVQSLTAGIALAAGIVLVSSNLSYLIVLDPNLEPAEIPSQYTGCLFPIHCFVSLTVQFEYLKP